MSANIYWEPATNQGKDVPVSAPQSFLRTLRKLTSTSSEAHEFVLSEGHLPGLEALATVQPYTDESKNPFTALANAIYKHGSIRVWAQY